MMLSMDALFGYCDRAEQQLVEAWRPRAQHPTMIRQFGRPLIVCRPTVRSPFRSFSRVGFVGSYLKILSTVLEPPSAVDHDTHARAPASTLVAPDLGDTAPHVDDAPSSCSAHALWGMC